MPRNHTNEAALMLVGAHCRIHLAKRPIDRKHATAQADGMARALYAVGYGHTPFHVEMQVHEVARHVTSELGDIPADHTPRRLTWMNRATELLEVRLESIGPDQ